ncbi:hypothetical protein AB4Z34_22655 [Ensifer sp. 2YAB10]|uniref:hypothetical protein n=1 Tax=Ensifer TaxID=106591 RepID=UPI001CC0A6A0|nr:hypothetical protein [Ensifer adhaerens]MBZ7921816.1 hypothetical protein [Ensifer adhaerens]UAX94216.1 hypothetical protein LAC78_08480 [Ensifer adhaerens]UAY01851.1 hypothetical protein LAC80_08490 [Ensifer adhaerens]UAY09234.1 hypothetical protein LAC81_08485 [Ensifer adhaerens]
MADLIKELVSGVVDSALREILKKTGVKRTSTKRTKRRARTTSGGGILGDILEAAVSKPAKKQVSRRRTAAARSKTRRRTA